MIHLTAFIAELRHRRVFRVAVVYAGVAFTTSPPSFHEAPSP